MSLKKLTSALIALLVVFPVLCQTSFQEDYRFLKHLEQIGQFGEGLYYLQSLERGGLAPGQIDTLHFLAGRFHYERNELDQSIRAFRQVSQRVPALWKSATFFSGFQYAYLRNLDASLDVLDRVTFREPLDEEVRDFQLACVYLLQRDFAAFDHQASHFSYDYYQLADYEEDMVELSTVLKSRKKKSPLVAGFLSAVVPGSGRYYLGQIGQGTMALVGTGVMGLQAWEAYRKDGLASARFIIFGSLFTVFYTANIWGSVVAVRVTERRYQDAADEAILVNMHLPLRVLYR